jgi:hypothetical protein
VSEGLGAVRRYLGSRPQEWLIDRLLELAAVDDAAMIRLEAEAGAVTGKADVDALRALISDAFEVDGHLSGPTDHRLRELVVGRLMGAGRGKEARELVWRAFSAAPSALGYEELRRVGGAEPDWTTRRRRALELLGKMRGVCPAAGRGDAFVTEAQAVREANRRRPKLTGMIDAKGWW